jgi:ABC-type transport system substrate-binding protein
MNRLRTSGYALLSLLALAALLLVGCASEPQPTANTPIAAVPTVLVVPTMAPGTATATSAQTATSTAGVGPAPTAVMPAPRTAAAALPTPSPNATSAPLPPNATVGSGGNLIMALGPQDPPSLDPALVSDTTSAFVTNQLFRGLVQLDANLEVQPALAQTWDISEDGSTYTFMLRPGARFADGRPITSEDVRYSLERATNPALAPSLPAAAYLNDIEGVAEKLRGEADEISGLRIIDDLTLEITLAGPRSYFLAKLSHPTAFVVDRFDIEAGGGDWTQNPNASGPFEIESWQRNEMLVLRRNENYFGSLARLDQVTFLLGAAASNPLVLYEQDEVDIVDVPSYALARVRDENNPLSEELVRVPQFSLTFIGMNVTVPPFDDPLVREAFTRLLDRQRIAEVTLNNSVQPAYGILPPGIPGYNPDLPPTEADIEEARDLLAESRYGSADALPPIVAYGGGWTTTLREVAREELGIEIEVRDYESFGDYLAALDERDFALFSFGWVADYPDPENFLSVLFRTDAGENLTDYSNPEVDALLDEAAATLDEEQRRALYQEAEQRILDDAPLIPIYHDVQYTLVKPYVRGLHITPMGILDLSTVELVRGE